MPGRRTRGVPGKRGLPPDFQFGPPPGYSPWSFMPHHPHGHPAGATYDDDYDDEEASYSSSGEKSSGNLGCKGACKNDDMIRYD